jgi:cytochrome oxidase Cu insertion factor (SCO1/SenC/PrrC family)
VLTKIESLLLFALAAALLPGCKTAGPSHKLSSHAQCPDCIEAPAQRPAFTATPFVTDWLAPDRRGSAIGGFSFENQDGATLSFRDLRGAPLAISFIYTRCENQRKCPLVTRTLGELALLVKEKAIVPSPALLLITYDPEYDKPAQLTSFAKTNRFQFTRHAMLLRPQPEAKDRLFSTLNVRVNYNQRGVNLHGIQLVLLDKEGRYVRTYHSLLWNNTQVINDLARLAAE